MDFDTDLTAVWLVLCAAILVHGWMLRRMAIGLIDPIVYVGLGSIAAVAMSFALSGMSLEFVRVIACIVTFWVGVRLTWPGPAAQPAPAAASELHQAQFTRIVMIGTLLFVLANLFFFAVVGPPALSADPSLAKTESYAGGFGWLRRLDWGLGTFDIVGLTYLLFTRRPRWAMLGYAAYVAISGLSGSKSALVPMLFAFALLGSRADLQRADARKSRWKKWLLPALAIAAVSVSLGVLVIEQGDFVGALLAFGVRLLYSSDVLIYWETPQVQHAFASLDFSDYLANLLAPVLGALRLVDYGIPYGGRMVQLSLGASDDVSESLGPNVPFYVSGEMYFGVGQYLYCCVIGMGIGWLRSRFVRAASARPLGLCMATTFVLLSPALAIDEALFMSQTMDLMLGFAIVYLAASAWPLMRSSDRAWRDRIAVRGP